MLVGLALALALALTGVARADGSPDITVADGAPTSVLHGAEVPVSLTAANPAGQPYGYNLAFRYVLPPGVSYVGGSESTQAGEPQILTDAPESEQTTLIWPNVDDLSPASSRTISFSLHYDPDVYDVGDSFPTEAGAYISTEPRDEADFNPDGTPGAPGPDSWTGAATDDAETLVTAIEVRKSEPHPEGEIPRGVHDHQTVYTLTVTNNHLFPTSGVRLEDYLPAGLEFLSCEGTPDHTTDAPANPGSSEEYPGSGPIVVGAVADCVLPDTVETVETDPDGSGPLPEGVYTHVVWNDIGDFAPDQVQRLRYRAAIPIRENTMDWPGEAVPPTNGDQAANLDNNSGPETYDEQPLLNGAIVSGTYESPANPSLPVSDEGTLLRTAEDIAIQKSNNKGSLEQGDLTRWTIDLQVSEYRYVDDVTINDVVPNGLCPLGPENYEHIPPAATAECDPVEGKGPSEPYTSVAEQANGTYEIAWDKTTFPELARVQPSETRHLTFWTRTRENYQAGFEDSTPVLSRDSVSNEIDTVGTDYVRCAPADPDCTGSGSKIDHDEPDGVEDFDVSASGKAATGPFLEKTVAADYPASGDCNDLEAAEYGKTLPLYGPGDMVCWKLRIAFPQHLDTLSLDVFDLLPHGIEYVPGSWQQVPGGNTVPIGAIDESTEGRLGWELGESDYVDAGGQIFEITLKSTVGSPLGHHSGDVEGNLLKFSYENTAGTSFALRDRVDFALTLPELALVKGVRQINGTGPVFGPDTDHKQVRGGDTVEYRVDVTNDGNADASSSRVWDLLPTGIDCADVVPASISDGGACVATEAGGGRIEWSGIALAAEETKTLTYGVDVPSDVAPEQTFVNTAGVVEFTYTTNEGTTYQLVPDNDVVEDDSLPEPNAAAAEDPSDVFTPAATIAKSRTTSVSEGGNNKNSQATIGETIEYTITTTIPAGTTVYDATVLDSLGARQSYVAGTLSGELNGEALPSGGVSVAEAANTITSTFPATYANPAGSGDDVLVLRFSAKVLDVNANTRGSNLPNSATLTFEDQLDRTVKRSDSVNTRIVEPRVETSKSDDTNPDRVEPGQVVEFTVRAANQSGGNVSTAHDNVVVDTLPAGTDPVDGGGAPIPDGGSVGPQNGVWDAGARTITWSKATTPALAAIAPGGHVDLAYRVRVEDPAVAGNVYENTVDLQAKSLDGSIPGVRTSASTASTAGDYEATAADKLLLGLPTIAKALDPDPVTIGDRIAWTVTVTMPANVQYYDTTVVDTIPDGFDFDSYGTATCVSGCLPGDPPISTFTVTEGGSGTLQAAWYLGDLAAATDREIEMELHGHLRDTYRSGGAKVLDGQSLTNKATVSTNRTDTVPGTPGSVPGSFDDTAGPATAVSHVVEPDLAIDKSASIGPYVEAGDVVTYTIEVTNEGTSPAHDIVVDDEPDSELTNVALGEGAAFNVDPWSAGDPDMRWAIPGPLAVGGSVTLTYTAKVKPSSALHSGDQIVNTAEIFEYFGVAQATREADGFEYRRYTGPDDSVVLKPDFPELSLVKTTGAAGSPDVADAEINQPFTWRVVVTNTANVAVAHDVDVVDTLPPNWEYIGGSSVLTPGVDVDPAVAPAASGDELTWSDVADLAPGESLTVVFQAKPLLAAATDPGHGAANPHVNAAASTADDGSGASGNADGPYTSNEDTARAILRVPDLAIVKTPDGGSAVAGEPSSFTVKVTNTGEATAHNVTVDDVLPDGLHYTSGSATAAPSAGFSETGVSPGPGPGETSIDWLVATLAPGAAVTITVPVTVDASVPDGTTLVNDAITKADDVPVPRSDEGSLLVKARADVAVTKTDDVDPVVAGTNLEYTIVVRNNGPSDAQDVVLSDTLPSPELTFVSVSPGAPTCTNEGNAISCALGTLAAGDSRTIHVTAKVDPAQIDPIDNTATVTTTTEDPEPENDSDDEQTEVISRADVSIVKTADRASYKGGETIVYTLVAHNDGPSTAREVTVHDALPDDVSFVSVSPGAPTCTESEGTVDCDLGSLAPGASETVEITATAKGEPPVSGDGSHDHQITVTKEEAYLSIPAGETRSLDLSCANGGAMVDGSLQVVAVDQGESLTDVHVLEARSVGTSTYRFAVHNDTAGQAQARPFGVCLPPRTEPDDGHDHSLIVGAPIETSASGLAVGRHEFHLNSPLGYRAVAPGIAVGKGDARIVTSEEDGSGWRFTVEVTEEPADVSLSIRPLKEMTGVTLDHAHDLLFEHPVVHVTVPAGQTLRQARVSCPDGYKGIVATYDLPPGLVHLGNVPEPINRDFDLLNTTGHPLEADLDLLCLRIVTGTEIDALDPVVNKATVASITFDPDLGNNSSSAEVTISRRKGSASASGKETSSSSSAAGTTLKSGAPPAPTASTKASTHGSGGPMPLRVGARALLGSGRTASVWIGCAGASPCSGTLLLSVPVAKKGSAGASSAAGPLRASASGTKTGPGARRNRSGRAGVRHLKVGVARYRLAGGEWKRLRVNVAKRYRRLVRQRGWVNATVRVRGEDEAITRRVRLHRPNRASQRG